MHLSELAQGVDFGLYPVTNLGNINGSTIRCHVKKLTVHNECCSWRWFGIAIIPRRQLQHHVSYWVSNDTVSVSTKYAFHACFGGCAFGIGKADVDMCMGSLVLAACSCGCATRMAMHFSYVASVHSLTPDMFALVLLLHGSRKHCPQVKTSAQRIVSVGNTGD